MAGGGGRCRSALALVAALTAVGAQAREGGEAAASGQHSGRDAHANVGQAGAVPVGTIKGS